MSFQWYDIVGTLGVAFVLWAYFALQTGRLRAEQLAYSLFNGIGAAFLVVSLLNEFNLPALLVEGAWVLISLIGIAKWWKARRTSRAR